MSFEPINIHYAGKRDPVHISLRRRATKGAKPRVVISLHIDVLRAVGLEIGGKAVPMVGREMDSGKLRIVPAPDDDAGAGVFVQAVRTSAKKLTRGSIWMRPWMDTRGVKSLSSMPCRYTVKEGAYIDIELPRELTELSPLKVVG